MLRGKQVCPLPRDGVLALLPPKRLQLLLFNSLPDVYDTQVKVRFSPLIEDYHGFSQNATNCSVELFRC
jgi:hypothetical protein